MHRDVDHAKSWPGVLDFLNEPAEPPGDLHPPGMDAYDGDPLDAFPGIAFDDLVRDPPKGAGHRRGIHDLDGRMIGRRSCGFAAFR